MYLFIVIIKRCPLFLFLVHVTKLLEVDIHRCVLTPQIHPEANPPPPQDGKENKAFSVPGKHSLVMNLQKTVAKKGSPDVLAPGEYE